MLTPISLGALSAYATEFLRNSRNCLLTRTNYSRRCPLASRATELLRNSRIYLLTPISLGALRGFAKRLPRRGGSGRHDKVEQMTEVACFGTDPESTFVASACECGVAAQGDRGFVNVTVVCLEIFATYGICGTTRGWSEGETSPSLGNRCRGYSQRSFERTSPLAVFLN